MTVVVIGAHGGVGRRLLPRLVDAGYETIGVVRSKDQFDAIRDAGAEPRYGDLEGEIAPAVEGADAVVFTAGAGGATGWDKTLMVDLWGAKRAVDASVDEGVGRFVMISSRGAGDPDARGGPIQPYLVAKHFADAYLRRSPLDETILRPTTLTDEEGTGRITSVFEDESGQGANIPRADVAQSVVASLANDATIGHAIVLYGGDTPIEDALHPGGEAPTPR